MQLLLATSNPHKVSEIREVFQNQAAAGGPALELVDLSMLERPIQDPVEDGRTFEANALLKARFYARATGMLCLADDSGLQVDALGGRPGVHSARYAGVRGPRSAADRANNALVLCGPGDTGALASVRGTVEGRIIGPAEAPRGEHGFGYDPLFLVPQLGRTTAELTPGEKNAISHRGRAAHLMWMRIRELNRD